MIDETPQPTLAIAVFAGGRSERMGTDKAAVRLHNGRTLFEHLYVNLRQLELPILLVGHAHGIDLEKFPDVHLLSDLIPNRGPVGALHALLHSERASHYLVVACDQPLVDRSILAPLMSEPGAAPIVYQDSESLLSPLPGLYPATLLPVVEQLLQRESASLQSVLKESGARSLRISDEQLRTIRGVNSPSDLTQLNESLSLQEQNSTENKPSA